LEGHGNQVGLVYAVDLNVLGNNVDTMKINTEILNDASKEVGLEVNAEETKYTLPSSRQNAGQNHVMKIANSSFLNVSQFKIWERYYKSKFD
jgi:hypothetical protein